MNELEGTWTDYMAFLHADFTMSYFVNWTCSEMGYHEFICSRSLFTFLPSYSNLDDWDWIEGRTKITAEENYPTIIKLDSNGTNVKHTSLIINYGQNDGDGRITWLDVPVEGNSTFRSYWIKKGISKWHVNRIDLNKQSC